ncbi:MAG: hypothetical protein AAF639_01835 [Chloroflexota bacterium]
MIGNSRIEVVDRLGWRKEYILQQQIINIGSDPTNDLVLNINQGTGVAARHLQVIPTAMSTTAGPNTIGPNRQVMRVVNLTDQQVFILSGRQSTVPQPGSQGNPEVAEGETRILTARNSIEISHGDQIRLGDFTLIFHSSEQRSEVVRLQLTIPNTPLAPEKSLDGILTLHHIGDKPGVQFMIDIEGLPDDCYEIEPGPVLFPDAERQIAFRLLHSKKPFPPAGPHEITFFVSAPEFYPGELANISHTIRVAPFHQHFVRIVTEGSPQYRLLIDDQF